MRHNTLVSTSILILSFLFSFSADLSAQKKKKSKPEPAKHYLDDVSLSGLKYREVGPALTSGRISDFAVNPADDREYYVATSSGGVWKTTNAGTTYKPIFDSQGSYSIGCVTMDPNDSNTIWVGTGENNNQRSVAYGDGVYKSTNGGSSWEHMGLKESEHIGKIIVHPDDSQTVYVAAIGPLWSSGGDRGLYKSTDGGKTWNATLEIDKYTGITDLVMDPSDPNIMYAAALQRGRHVYTYLGGGPGSAIYKSTDAGETWNMVNKGLPSVEMGRIGLSISPAAPKTVYAIVEAAEGKSGFYKTTNGGVVWEKVGSYVTSGNYYQEIIADPIDPNIIYGMDTWLHKSIDGGKTFKKVPENTKHVDNHCIWINPKQNKHWRVGCDGGIYETWDNGSTWEFKANLPVTQFYKVSVDNAKPFYHIYGGTQDNFSIGGPSRTQTKHGILNSDWYITHGGDGFESQADPENPDLIYAQSQYGVLVRFDKRSGEEVGIQPKERKGEDAYRWNWDAPLIASPHKSGRVYFAANKVFRSDDYGNSWEVISDDLSRQLDRNTLPVMDRVWGVDAVVKNRSTSPYGTIVAMSESPINENLIIVGTDDGLIHVSENGGDSWRKIDNISGVPNRTYVNMVYASKHDENVIYALFNHHKYGDFKPYVFKSSNKGVSWTNISNNLPKRGSSYSIEEDHEDPNLLFVGTEFSAFFSQDGGKHWKKLSNGLPTVAVRDLAIQKDQEDLVLGTFGRGFYVLDDYSALRHIEQKNLDQTATIFPIRDALQYEQSKPLGLAGKSFQGDAFYAGEDLGPVALIRYHIKDDYTTLAKDRKKKEKELIKAGRDTPFPSYEEYKAEKEQKKTQLVFTIKDEAGKIVRKLYKKPSKGLHTLKWDLRYPSKEAINFDKPSFYNPFNEASKGIMAKPGKYSVEMSLIKDGEISQVAEAVSFNVVPLDNGIMPAKDKEAKLAFQQEVTEFGRSMEGAQYLMGELNKKMKYMEKAVEYIEDEDSKYISEINSIKQSLKNIREQMYGDPIKRKLDIDQPVTPAGRLGWINYEQGNSSADPTGTHKMSLAIAKEEFAPIFDALMKLAKEDIPALEQKLEDADAPYTPGRSIQMMQGGQQ